MSNILVTGDKGKLGTHLVARIGGRFEITGYDIKDGWDILKGDLAECAMDCDAIVHLAAMPGPIEGPTWEDYFITNCVGTYHVADAAMRAGIKRLLFASSTAYYGCENGIPFRRPVIEESPPIATYLKANALQCYPQALMYSQSKVIAENILAYYGLTRQLEVVCLRFGALGPVTSLDHAAEAIITVLDAPGPFWYEAFNVIDDGIDWADNSRAKRVLGLDLS